MRFPAWLPVCLALVGCASARGVPEVGRFDWVPALDPTEGAAFVASPATALAAPAAPSAPLPVPSGGIDGGLLAFQQGWGQPQSGPQGGPPPAPPTTSSQEPTAYRPAAKDFSRKGVYLSVGILTSDGDLDFQRADETFDIPIVPNADESTSVEGDGMSLRVGFRTAENFAFEILLDFAHYDMTEKIPGINFDGTLDTFTVGFNGKVYIPIDRVEPYFLFGAGIGAASIDADYDDGVNFVSTTGSFTTFNLKVGAGVDIYAHRNFAVFLEWALNMPFGFESSGHSYAGITNDLVFGVLFRF